MILVDFLYRGWSGATYQVCYWAQNRPKRAKKGLKSPEFLQIFASVLLKLRNTDLWLQIPDYISSRLRMLWKRLRALTRRHVPEASLKLERFRKRVVKTRKSH